MQQKEDSHHEGDEEEDQVRFRRRCAQGDDEVGANEGKGQQELAVRDNSTCFGMIKRDTEAHEEKESA